MNSQTSARPASSSRSLGECTDSELIHEAFLATAWGDAPEQVQRQQDIEQEAHRRTSYLIGMVRKAFASGRTASELAAQLEKEFQAHGEQLAREWIEAQCRREHFSVARHLSIILKKAIDNQQQLSRRFEPGQSQHHSTLPPVRLTDGRHPNSLPHLAPAAQWKVYIDESGDIFQHPAAEAVQNRLPGRVVALVVPAGVELPALKSGFHAKEEAAADVDRAIDAVVSKPVGVFGFRIDDPSSRHHYWFGQIHHLIRWVLLQLPLSAGPNNSPRVDIFIEQRGAYSPTDDLSIMAEALESEFRGLDPQRFADFRLSMAFMDASEPLNGYVDALAFTWGSSASVSKDRLKKSALRGHCLIECTPGGEHLHHLYLALSENRPLRPADWYALCNAASHDAEGGFLRRSLEQLGRDCPPARWQSYLTEVEHHLHHKDFHLTELGHALDWLQQHAAAGEQLPAPLQLMLHSARLASANHQGRIDSSLLEKCLDLQFALRDEAPMLACEALLRVTIAATNAFEFDALEDSLRDWLAQPLTVGGLANHGKLRSTLGQLQAFRGQYEAAATEFDHAQALFERLSDPAERAREQQQTRHYQLINRLATVLANGSTDEDITALLEALRQHCNAGIASQNAAKDSTALSRSLAHSKQSRRYAHHLWLRTLISFPQALGAARSAYLALRPQWQYGSDHPWPLIGAWRGWLLAAAGEENAAGQEFDAAIALCAEGGPTLQWMAEVLRTLASNLQLPLSAATRPSAAQRAQLTTILPQAPHAALAAFAADTTRSDSARLQHLAACLPFNFH